MIIISEPDEVRSHAEKITEQIQRSFDEATARGNRVSAPSELVLGWDDVAPWLSEATALETLSVEESFHIACQPALEFAGRVPEWVAEIRRSRELGDTMIFVAHSPGRAERTIEVLSDYEIYAAPIEGAEEVRTASVLVGVGHLSRGFRFPDAGLQFWSETDIFEEERKTHERRRSATRTFLSDFRDLKVGDLVVHVDHGIGVFVGLKRIDVGLDAAGVHGAPLRRRGQAVRSGRAARPGPEIHRCDASRRSTSSAGRRGKKRRRASRRRCATWRRSCSSSMPRARPCPAMLSAPTRTGSRSSKTRSNGS